MHSNYILQSPKNSQTIWTYQASAFGSILLVWRDYFCYFRVDHMQNIFWALFTLLFTHCRLNTRIYQWSYTEKVSEDSYNWPRMRHRSDRPVR